MLIMIELTFLKKLILKELGNQKNVIFVTIDIFETYVRNRCHDLLMMFMNLSYIAISAISVKTKMLIVVALVVELVKAKL